MNINEDVEVSLTQAGAKIYNTYMSAIPNWEPKCSRCLKNMKLSLWSLMKIFGPHIHLGMEETPFVDNEITLPL